jgi:hypothetical protein
MTEVLELEGDDPASAGASHAADVLEAGGVVVFPSLPFELANSERRFLDPAILTESKNVSLEPSTGALGGTRLDGEDARALGAMVKRFADRAEHLLSQLTPSYSGALQRRRTSFRPGAVADRALSRRKDDRRLHIDAFPSNPVQGRRILRVFANVNPDGCARLWDVGEEDFERFALRFEPRLHMPHGGGWLMQKLGLTKGRRTKYDQAMLDLHDLAKLDDRYQERAPKRRLAFPAGAMWVVYTDSVLHAALAGQHALEQTFLLPIEAMRDEARAPVRILERITGRALI